MSGLKFSNFFKDSAGRESITASLLFLSFFPSTYVMIVSDSEEIYYAYIAAFAGLAMNKQWAGRNANMDTQQLETHSIQSSGGDGDSVVVESKSVAKRRPSVPKRKTRPF